MGKISFYAKKGADFGKVGLTGAPEATRTPGTGIRNQKTVIFHNQGKDLSIGLLPFSIKGLTYFLTFDRLWLS